MSKIEKIVFISYRRTNYYTALAVYQNLTSHDYDVFFDYESIKSGDFGQVILNQIAARAHFILILTPSALERCNEPGDWLRREIEHALEYERNVIPLTFDEFDFLEANKHFTGKLELLKKYNAQHFPKGFFEDAMTKVRNGFLNTPLDAVLHPTPPPEQAIVEEKKAEAASQPDVTENQLSAEEYFERAYQAHEQKDYDKAIADYSQAILLKPDYAVAYVNRGAVRAAQGDYDLAIVDYDQAILLKPDFTLAYNNRGVVHAVKSNTSRAIDDYDQAIYLKPDFAGAYSNRGETYFAMGKMQEALADFKKAYDLEPAFNFSLAGLGITYHKMGNIQQAVGLWKMLMGLDSRYRDAEWTGKILNWPAPLLEEAKKLVARL